MSFSFDISYKLTPNIADNEELECTILNITKQYISCTWCAADCEGNSKNLGFNITANEISCLEEIIRKVRSTPNIYIDFIVAHTKNDGPLETVDIYRSPTFLSSCRFEYPLIYKQQVEQFTDPNYVKLNKMCNET